MIIRNNLIQDSKDEISSLLNKMNPAREKLLEIFHLTNISSTKKYFSFTSNRPFFQTHHIIKNITKTKKYPIKSDSQDFISFYPFPFRKEGPSNVMEYCEWREKVNAFQLETKFFLSLSTIRTHKERGRILSRQLKYSE